MSCTELRCDGCFQTQTVLLLGLTSVSVTVLIIDIAYCVCVRGSFSFRLKTFSLVFTDFESALPVTGHLGTM